MATGLSLYIGVSLNDMEKLLTVIVGAHPSQLEPCWEDMSTWYQVSFVCVSQVLTLVSRSLSKAL